MGSSQSTRRPRVRSVFPTSSDYTQLPSKQQLLKDYTSHECNCSVHDDTSLEDIVNKNAINEKKVTDLEQKIERLEQLLLSKTAAMERSITENATNEAKITHVDQKIERLKRLLFSRKAMEGSSWEIAANQNKKTGHEQKIKALERIIVKNAKREESIRELQAKVDGLVFMSSSQNSTLEVELGKDADEPEFVKRIMGVLLLLIFVVIISIGMQL